MLGRSAKQVLISQLVPRRQRELSPGELLGFGLIAGLLLLFPALIGTVHTVVLIPLGLVTAVAIWVLRQRCLGETLGTWALLLFAAVTLLQTVPLPPRLLGWLDGESSAIWTQAHALSGQPGWQPIALEPAAARVEALRLAIYAAIWSASFGFSRRYGTRRVARCIFGVCLFVGVAALLHQLAGARSVFGFYRVVNGGLAASPLINPNNFSGLMNLGVFCALGLALGQRTTQQRRVAWGIGAAVLFAASWSSGSRAGVASLLIGSLLLLGLLAAKRANSRTPIRTAWVLPSVALAGIGLFTAAAMGRGAAELTDGSLTKLNLLRWASQVVGAHPITGVGPGGMAAELLRFRDFGGNQVFHSAENWALSWLGAWGIPLGAVAIALLLAALNPRKLLLKADSRQYALYAGCVTLCAHNLLDLAFEVPGVMVPFVAVLGALWGARHLDEAPRKLKLPSASRTGVTLCAALVATVSLVLWLPNTLPGEHRAQLRQGWQTPDGIAQIRSALRQHPGDAYVLRAGAAALAANGQPGAIRWLNASLGRDPNSGRSFLLLARILFSRGAIDQALISLREAASKEPLLAPRIATWALAWGGDQAHRAVPDGPLGAPVLLQLARGSERSAERLRFAELARKRTPADPEPLAMAAEVLSNAVVTEEQLCLEQGQQCLETAERYLQEAVATGRPVKALVRRRGRLLLAQGARSQAFDLLRAGCGRDRQSEGCLRLLLKVAETGKTDDFVAAAEAYLDAVCADESRCERAERQIARRHEQRGEMALALNHYRSVASKSASVFAWLNVARAARALRRSAEATRALQRAEALCPSDDPELLRRVKAEKDQLLRSTL